MTDMLNILNIIHSRRSFDDNNNNNYYKKKTNDFGLSYRKRMGATPSDYHYNGILYGTVRPVNSGVIMSHH